MNLQMTGRWTAILTLSAWLVTMGTAPRAQETPPAAGDDGIGGVLEIVVEEIPLLEQEPFDLITLDANNENAQVKVLPLPFPGRKVPSSPAPGAALRVVLIDRPDQEYEVYWAAIARVELYEQLLLKEAIKLTTAGDFDEAFKYYYRLNTQYPNLPGLKRAFTQFLINEVVALTRAKKFPEAMAVAEDLYSRDPTIKLGSRSLLEVIGRLMDYLVEDYNSKENYAASREILQRVAKQYGENRPPSVANWARTLAQLATKKRDEARKEMEAMNYRGARRLSREMIRIWPTVDGAAELDAEMARQYPMVLVGVTQPANTYNARRLDNWGSRRTGRLVRRSFVDFMGAGPEGGEYEFSLGTIERSEDQRQMILRLNQFAEEGTQQVNGYEVANRLLNMATPGTKQYLPAWGGLVKGVSITDVLQVNVDLRRPHVLPEALLRVPLYGDVPSTVGDSAKEEEAQEEEAPESDTVGEFRVSERTEDEIRFLSTEFVPGGRLAEIVEKKFDETQRALQALKSGEIDVIDRLFPADGARLKEQQSFDSEIMVDQYSLPTVHLLLINTENPFLADRNFRRALIFAIDRENILKRELLGGRDIEGCQVISGPFPAGAGDRDPLGYAYDHGVGPRRYIPRLCKLLTVVAVDRAAEVAKNRGEEPPELKPLLLGHPAHEAARVASEAIAAHLKVAGIECNLKEFPPGVTRDEDGDCDLTYAEIAIWEPVTDARRLMGEDGLAPTNSPYVSQVIRWLDQAENWGEVRDRLLQLHRTAHNEVSILPLWQTVDFFAYNKRLRNVGESPVWLYQNVDQWRVGAGVPAE